MSERAHALLYRLTVVLLSLLASTAHAQHVVAVGGGERTPAILAEIVRLGGGADARLVVVPLASGSPGEVGESQAAEFKAAGAGRVAVLLDVSDTEALRDATAVWFSGGDQNRLARALLGTEALCLVGEVLDRGGVIAGTSAGAAVMSRAMITGDMRASERSGAPGRAVTADGFGFLDDVLGVPVVVDQHFANRDRHGRLLGIVLGGPARLGLGIDEATALVASDGQIRVVGLGNVTVLDPRGASVPYGHRGAHSARRVFLQLLADGDSLSVQAP